MERPRPLIFYRAQCSQGRTFDERRKWHRRHPLLSRASDMYLHPTSETPPHAIFDAALITETICVIKSSPGPRLRRAAQPASRCDCREATQPPQAVKNGASPVSRMGAGESFREDERGGLYGVGGWTGRGRYITTRSGDRWCLQLTPQKHGNWPPIRQSRHVSNRKLSLLYRQIRRAGKLGEMPPSTHSPDAPKSRRLSDLYRGTQCYTTVALQIRRFQTDYLSVEW